MQQLEKIKNELELRWQQDDWTGFKRSVESSEAALTMSKAVFSATSNIMEQLMTLVPRAGRVLGVLSIAFGVLESIVDVINFLVFGDQSNEFEPIIEFLEIEFDRIHYALERNYNKIKELMSNNKCDETMRQFRDIQLKVKAFYGRYTEMLNTTRHNWSLAMMVFDYELRQYEYSESLLTLYQKLSDRKFYTNVMNYCAKGHLQDYLHMCVEFFQTLQQAVALDMTGKLRLNGLSKSTVERERHEWAAKVEKAVELMEVEAFQLVNTNWYDFFVDDVETLKTQTGDIDRHKAAGSIASFFGAKFAFIRVAVIIGPAEKIVFNSHGETMTSASSDNFLCYRANRADRTELLLILCRNWLVSRPEQEEVDNKFALHRVGVTNMSLMEALNNHSYDQVETVMQRANSTFFPAKVVGKVRASEVAVAESKASESFIFYKTGNYQLEVLVVAKAVPDDKPAIERPVIFRGGNRHCGCVAVVILCVLCAAALATF